MSLENELPKAVSLLLLHVWNWHKSPKVRDEFFLVLEMYRHAGFPNARQDALSSQATGEMHKQANDLAEIDGNRQRAELFIEVCRLAYLRGMPESIIAHRIDTIKALAGAL